LLSLTAVTAALLPVSAVADPEMKVLGCTPKMSGLHFHPKAIRLNQDGAVLVEYSVSSKGVTEGVVVLKSTASEPLEESAVRLVAGMRCKPGEDWQQTGGPQRRLKLNVLFQYIGRDPVKPIEPTEDVITVSTEPI
jgi:TonB family protein